MLSISLENAFILLGFYAFIASILATLKYRNVINPITSASITQVGMYTILSGILANYILATNAYSLIDSKQTILFAAINFTGLLIPFLFKGSFLTIIFFKIMNFTGLNLISSAKKYNTFKFFCFLLCIITSYCLLLKIGGGGILWITDTRRAYQNFRSGAGLFFLLSQWAITFTFIYYLWSKHPIGIKLLIVSVFFSSLAYFTGSKNNILIILIVALFYRHFKIKRISFYNLCAMGLFFSVLFLSLLILQGSTSSLLESTFYFKDYFDTTTRFLSRFDEFEFHYGKGWLSSLWFYFPRGLFPGKPYEYGQTLIHQVLFPGKAEMGNTPGLLNWSLSYLDFGVLGVFFHGLINGFIKRMAYEYFLKNREEFFAFILMIHFSIWPIFSFLNQIPTLIMCLFVSIFLRLVLVSRSSDKSDKTIKSHISIEEYNV